MDQSIQNTIITSCQHGDWSRFGELYDYYIKRIYSFVYYKTNHRETTEDIVSQSFMKAVSKIHTYNPSKGTFSSWLYQIAEHATIDHIRQRKYTEQIDENLDLRDDAEIEDVAQENFERAELKKYLDELTPEQRTIVQLRIWDELSYSEIADIVGKSEDSCKMTYSRALKALKGKVPVALLILLLLNM